VAWSTNGSRDSEGEVSKLKKWEKTLRVSENRGLEVATVARKKIGCASSYAPKRQGRPTEPKVRGRIVRMEGACSMKKKGSSGGRKKERNGRKKAETFYDEGQHERRSGGQWQKVRGGGRARLERRGKKETKRYQQKENMLPGIRKLPAIPSRTGRKKGQYLH